MFKRNLTYVLTLLTAVLLAAFSGVASAASYVTFLEPVASPDSTGKEQVFRLYFACDKTSYDGNYMDNELTAEAIMALLQELDSDRIESVTVTSYASPEGNYEHNLMLSRLRGLCFESMAKTRFPLMNGHIRLIDGGEAWEPFRQQVFEDMQLDESVRVRILNLLDDDSVRPDTKKWRLQNRFGAETWRYILKNHFRYLRCVEIRISYIDSVSQDTVVTDTTITSEVKVTETVSIYILDDSELLTEAVTEEQDLLVELEDGDNTAYPKYPVTEDIADQPVVTETEPVTEVVEEVLPAEKEYRPLTVVGTNLLLDLAITPNVSVEQPLGHSWSVLVDYTFPWWLTRANDRAWQMLKLDFGARYWLSPHDITDPWDILTGHFVGIDLGAGYYDIEPKHKGYQGEFQTAGVEYGYAWRLSRSWRLEAYAALGWMATHYRYYEGNVGDTRLFYQHHGRYTWIGPTKAGVSIKYIIPVRVRRKDR